MFKVSNQSFGNRRKHQDSSAFRYYKSYWLDTIGESHYCIFKVQSGTNNAAEIFNRHLKGKFQSPHPNVWLFCEGLTNHLHVRDIEFAQVERGERLVWPSGRLRKFNKDRLNRLWSRLESGNILPLEFIREANHFFEKTMPPPADDDVDDQDDTGDDGATGGILDGAASDGGNVAEEGEGEGEGEREGEREPEGAALRTICVVCLSDLAFPCAIIPCFHAQICFTCATRIFEGPRERRLCPVCRRPIERIQRIFMTFT